MMGEYLSFNRMQNKPDLVMEEAGHSLVTAPGI